MTFKPCPPDFFMVVVEGRGGPKKRHATLESAQAEAERLRRERVKETMHVVAPVMVDDTGSKAVYIVEPVSVLPVRPVLSLKPKVKE